MVRLSNDELLQTDYWIIDILPKQVPEHSDGQYFEIEKYLLSPPRIAEIKKKHLGLILKLNCYRTVSVDGKEQGNPPPFMMADAVLERSVMFRINDALLVSEPDETYLTLYHPDDELLELVRMLTSGEGLYLWKPESNM